MANDEIVLKPTAAFLRARRADTPASAGGGSLLLLLGAPRYESPREHWKESWEFTAGEHRDPENGLKEAVCAVEGLCRTIAGDSTATLGDLIRTLKATRRIDGALAKTLEGIWGFASNSPGVRHGASTPAALDAGELRFALATCEASMKLLLALDR
jgi:hypothetical protein